MQSKDLISKVVLKYQGYRKIILSLKYSRNSELTNLPVEPIRGLVSFIRPRGDWGYKREWCRVSNIFNLIVDLRPKHVQLEGQGRL